MSSASNNLKPDTSDNCLNLDLQEQILSEYSNRRKGRKHLVDFITYTKKDYMVNWHHLKICDEIDSLLDGKYELLVVSTPPRFGKSEIVSRRLPAYALGTNPDSSIIACSYSADLSSRMNRDVQRIMDSREYHNLFPDVKLNNSNVRPVAQGTYLRNSDIFEIVGRHGVYRSCGVGGGIMGMGFSRIGIIDDPLKNREEAESVTIRNKIYEWYTDVFYTRREENAPILITMTRWHEDDLIGRILDVSEAEVGTDKVKTIIFPALSEEEIPSYDSRTKPNQSLWRDKFPEKTLLKIKATVPVYTWLSLYQQRPSAAEGNLFKRSSFRYFTESENVYDLHTPQGIIKIQKNLCSIFQTCDPAATIKTHSDFFVLSTWAYTPQKDLLLLDVFRSKIEGADHMTFFRTHSKFPDLCLLGFESVGIGKTTYQNLVRERFPVVDLQPKGDKFTRALSAAIRLNMGTTYFRYGANWLNDWEDELLKFPNAVHDDQVDTLSYADYCICNNIIRLSGTEATKPRPESTSKELLSKNIKYGNRNMTQPHW